MTPRVLLSALLGLGACAATPPNPVEPDIASATDSPAPAGERLACSFFWRESNAHPHSVTEHLEPGATATVVSVGDFEVTLAASANDTGGRALDLRVGSGEGAAASRYDFGAHRAAAHLPASGHGFTGLRYVSHPQSGSELQYFCGAYPAGVDVTDDSASQQHPGPSVPKGRVSCEVELLEEGTSTEARTVGPGLDAPERVGPFSFGVQYLEPEYDAGGVMVDVSADGAPHLHVLYQLSGPGLPANTLPDPSFTGVQTVEGPGAASLRWRCAVVE